MSTLVVIADIVALVAFLAAGVLALVLSFGSLITRPARYAFVFAMLLYAFVSMSNVLEHAGITAQFDKYEDLAEILFVPALAYAATAIYLNYQVVSQRRMAQAEKQQNDLLVNIVDTVPGGIMLVDPTGGVSFANDGAERILGVSSDGGGSLHVTPPWRLSDPMTGAETTLADIVTGGAISRRPLRATWPDGRHTDLTLSATPMSGRDGRVGGSVIAFDEYSAQS